MASNAHLFRALNRAEETMMRASMPRTDAADPKTVPLHRDVRTWRLAELKPLTTPMAEMFAAAKVVR